MGVVTGTFVLPTGSPVANGQYQFKLSGDAIAFAVPSCDVPRLFTGSLDTLGAFTATFAFNDALSTSAGLTTFYQCTIKDSGGGQVWNENYILTGTAANLNLIPPAGSGFSQTPLTTTATSILLETNAATNSSQVLLNLSQGSGITLTNVAGTTTISSSGGGGTAFTTAGNGFFYGPGFVGSYDTVPQSSANSIAFTATSVYVTQFMLQSGFTIRKVGFTTGHAGFSSAGMNAMIGIYDSSGAKLLDTGAFAGVSTGTNNGVSASVNTLTAAAVLTAGIYYMAWSVDSIPANGAQGTVLVSSGLNNTQDLTIINSGASRYGQAANGLVGTVLPATLGVITGYTVNASLPHAPAAIFMV